MGLCQVTAQARVIRSSIGQKAEASRAFRDHIWNWFRLFGDSLLVMEVTGPFQT